jgi:anhydro-N-acetylmuramic acid kinase
MSGTSLDGVDGVLARFTFADDKTCADIDTVATAYLPFPDALREELMRLQAPSDNELHREALAANQLARIYADCVAQLLAEAELTPAQVKAVGVHGQTIRHRPELGYTWQTNNPALLAELCGIDVIADLRSRDIAAGGQGAPLVPAFHQAVFGSPDEVRVVANIGGIGNISVLDHSGRILGFDTGPGNVLMDAWIAEHLGKTYDANGLWASGGTVMPDLLTPRAPAATCSIALGWRISWRVSQRRHHKTCRLRWQPLPRRRWPMQSSRMQAKRLQSTFAAVVLTMRI